MATQAPQHNVIFVAWNAEEAGVWRELSAALKTNKALPDRFRFFLVGRGSGFGASEPESLWSRLLKPVRAQARRLQLDLRGDPFRVQDEHDDPEITFVAHGKACRAVKQYLLSLVGESQDDWRDRRRVRQAIFVCPARPWRTRMLFGFTITVGVIAVVAEVMRHVDPRADSVFASVVSVMGTAGALGGLLLAILLSSESLRRLGWEESVDTDELDKTFDELIVNGSKLRSGTWPFPTQTVQLDRFAPGPVNAAAIADAIQAVKGHKNVYELDVVKLELEVGPVSPAELPAGARRLGSPDNGAHRIETVTFSEGNNTADTELQPYKLMYRTSGYMELDAASGYMEQDEAGPATNLWEKEEKGQWRDEQKNFVYKFRPTEGITRALGVTIYGGYNRGDRTAHSHIDVCKYIGSMEHIVDLREYRKADWTINRRVEAYYFPPGPPKVVGVDRHFEDQGCGCLKDGRHLTDGSPVEVDEIETDVFQWTAYSVRNGGMIGFLFDVTPPEGKS